MNLDNMKLPKVNQRKAESKRMQLELEIKFNEMIEVFEKENNYKFKIYEIDNMLLSLVKRNHESYLRTDFGNDMID